MGQFLLKVVSRFQQNRGLNVLQLLIIVLLISTIQDFLHSRRNDYSFYFSESLLFNTFWILFFPIAFVLHKLIRSNTFRFAEASNFSKIAVLMLTGSVVHILLYSLGLYVLSVLFFQQDYTFLNNLNYTLANDFYKYPLVYGGIAYFFIQKSGVNAAVNEEVPSAFPQVSDKIMIQKGRKTIAIDIGDIFSISSSSPYIAIRTDDRKYLHNETLKSIQDKLDANLFVRIHKSSIIQMSKVSSVKSRLNGDYDILMQNGEVLRLSRNYVKGFKLKMSQSL